MKRIVFLFLIVSLFTQTAFAEELSYDLALFREISTEVRGLSDGNKFIPPSKPKGNKKPSNKNKNKNKNKNNKGKNKGGKGKNTGNQNSNNNNSNSNNSNNHNNNSNNNQNNNNNNNNNTNTNPGQNPTPAPNNPQVTTKTITSRISGKSISISSDETGYTGFISALNEGFDFEVIEASLSRWTFRLYFQGQFLSDASFENYGTSTGLPNDKSVVFGTVVGWARDYKNRRAQGEEPRAVVPDIQDPRRTSYIDNQKKDLYRVTTQLIESGIFFNLQTVSGEYRIVGDDRSGNRVISKVDTTAGILYKSDGSIILLHEELSYQSTTFRADSAAYNFVIGALNRQPRVTIEGYDAAGSPLQIVLTFPGNSKDILFSKARLKYTAAGASTLVNDFAQTVADVTQFPTEARQALVFAVFRNFSANFSGSYTNFTLNLIDPRGVNSIRFTRNGDSYEVEAEDLTLGKVSGGTGVITVENTYLFYMAGLFQDAARAYPSISVKLGGGFQHMDEGFLEATEDGQTYKIYGAGATIFPDGTLTIPGNGGVDYKTNDPAYTVLKAAVEDEYTVMVNSSNGSYNEIYVGSAFDQNVYIIYAYKNGQAPTAQTITPNSASQYNSLKYLMLSNILNMQFQTSMGIISNIAPTPVEYVYKYY